MGKSTNPASGAETWPASLWSSHTRSPPSRIRPKTSPVSFASRSARTGGNRGAASRRLHPAEDLLHPFPCPLAEAIPAVPNGTPVNRRALFPRRMGRSFRLWHTLIKPCIVAPICAHGDASGARPAIGSCFVGSPGRVDRITSYTLDGIARGRCPGRKRSDPGREPAGLPTGS